MAQNKMQVQRVIKGVLYLGWLLIGIAACSPTPTPLPEDATLVGTVVALPPAPEFREPVELISAENANRLALIGRLDLPPGPASSLFAFSFSPDGTRLAALSNDLLLGWDLARGTLLFSSSRNDATRVYYAPDKTELYTLSPDGIIKVFGEDGTEKTTLEAHDRYNGSSTYDPFQGMLALGGEDGEIKVWDLARRTSLATLRAHNAPVERIALSPDMSLLASVGYEFKVRLWDWRQRRMLYEWDLNAQASAQLVFAPDNRQLAVSTSDNTYVYDVATGKVLFTHPTPNGGAESVLTYTPDGRYLVTAGSTAALTFWDTATGERMGQIPEVTQNRISVAFSPSGDLMVTSVLDQASALWNLATIAPEGIQRVALNPGSRRIVNVGWTMDGFIIAFFDAQGSVYLWGIPADGT